MAKDGESDNHHHHQDHVDEMPNDDNCHGETSNSRPLVDNDSRSITAMNIAATNSSASATNNADSSHQIHPDATNCMRNTHSCDIDAVSDRAECFAASPLSFHSGDIDIRYSTGNNKDPYLPRILTPPRQSEQSAKEQLIERERQARMERERARLKRQFTLSREKEEEEKAIMNSVELKPRGDLKNDDEDEDSKSLACTAGEEESDEEHDIKGVNTESAGYKTDSVNDDKSVTKLGFTMERFLQNNSMGVENMEVHPDLQAVSVPLPLPAAAASEHEEEEVGSTVSIEVRMCHSDVSVSCRTDRDEITSESNVDLNVEEGVISHHIPRLAQLAEAQILVDMAEIDYASVGNMPPRSVRDEQQLPDLSGMSNASFDLTHTTVQESDTSICAPSVRTRTSSVGNAIVSPGESNIMGQLPVDNVTSNASYNSIESNPSEILNGGNALDDNGKLDAIMLEGCDEQLSSSPCAPLVSTTPFDEYSFNQEDTTTKEEHLPHRSEDLGKGTLHPERCNAEDCGDTQLDDSTVHIYKYPNRIVRPGMIKVGEDTKLSKGHRRAQTTPNIPSFIDDFDYCKYNNHEPTSNQSQIFGGAGTCFDDISGKTTSKWNLISHPSYGAIDPEEGAQFLNPSLQNEEEDDPNGVFALDSMIESVFSSLRSMSTADFQAEINDCDRYSSSHIMKRAFSARLMPLIVTLAIELPVSFAILSGNRGLCSLVGFNRYKILMALLPATMALSGNCGLQSSILSTRAISHLQVAKSNYTKWLIDEIQVAATLGVAMGAAIGTIAFQMSGFDAFFGIVVFLANALAVLTSGLTGTVAPLLFTFFFHREEEKWNSLLATALQDVIGFFSMIFCVAGCYWLFSSDDQDSSCL